MLIFILESVTTGFGDGPNLYAYVKNSPLRYADQYGLEAEDISGLEYDGPDDVASYTDGAFCASFDRAAKEVDQHLSNTFCSVAGGYNLGSNPSSFDIGFDLHEALDMQQAAESSSSSSDYGLLGKIGQGVWDGPEGLAFDYLTGNMEDMSTHEAVAYGAGVAVSALAYAPMKVVKGIGLGFKA
ncbi:MAG: hypothetical protein GWP59_09150 [Chlamydiales bacterium]|nr:hypothetical protein [Chlamydiales bacterium]